MTLGRAITTAVLLFVAACGGSKAPATEQPDVGSSGTDTVASDAGPSKPEGCTDPEDCAAVGALALLQGQGEVALAMLEYACAESSPAGCQNLSTALRSKSVPEDPAKAHAAALRGCELGNAPSCIDLGVDEAFGLGGATLDFEAARKHFELACNANEGMGCRFVGVLLHEGQLGSPDHAGAMTYFQTGCELGEGASCFNAGALLAEGFLGEPDLSGAGAFMTRACELGDQDGCSVQEQIAAQLEAQANSKIPDANLQIGEATVDGLTVANLECRVEGGGGLLGSMALLGAMSKRKASIDKCGKPGTEVEVTWTASGGKISKAEGEGSEGACVAKALKKLDTPIDGECAATIVLGP